MIEIPGADTDLLMLAFKFVCSFLLEKIYFNNIHTYEYLLTILKYHLYRG